MTRLLIFSVLFLAAACSGETKPSAQGAEPTAAASKKEKPESGAPSSGKADADHKDEPEGHEELPSVVRLSPKVIRDAGIKTAPAVLKALPQTVNLTGEVISDPDHTAKVTVRVPGRILTVHVKEGDRVKAGQLLTTVESPELAKARAAFTSAQAKARSARQNAERLSNVAKKGLASGQEVATAEAEAQSIEAEARAARQTLAAFGPSAAETGADAALLELRAPIAGSVLSRDAIRGQTVTADHVVATIADLDKTYFTARLFEKDLARVRVGSPADVRLNAYPNEVFEATVESVGKQIDPTARTVTARIAIKNRNDLIKVGLFGTALVVVPDATPRTPRVVVPLSAVTKLADKDAVFVKQPDADFEVHPVTLGRSAAGQVEILSGLREKEQVAVEGVFTLKSAVLKSTFGEED